MKILFDHPNPFLLAHGGFQTQIQQTKAALEELGLEVEYLRWWDGDQRGNLIHFFGRPNGAYIDFAHGKGIPVVMSELLTGLGSRSELALRMQKAIIETIRAALPKAFWAKMGWDAYLKADRVLALTGWEAQLMQRIFGASPARVAIVPNGVNSVFLTFSSDRPVRGKFLVCTATITQRKRVLELANAALAADTPVWILGQPYAQSDPYAESFIQLSRQHPEIIRYEGGISDVHVMARIYREARGFVLLSAMESLSLSALEAAACGCPLLLSDLPWARSFFGDTVSYSPIANQTDTAKALRTFYDSAPDLAVPRKPSSWTEVGQQLKGIYEATLSERRD